MLHKKQKKQTENKIVIRQGQWGEELNKIMWWNGCLEKKLWIIVFALRESKLRVEYE